LSQTKEGSDGLFASFADPRVPGAAAHVESSMRLRRIYAACCIFYTVLMDGFLGFLLLIHAMGDR
jgi:hypothetical protein